MIHRLVCQFVLFLAILSVSACANDVQGNNSSTTKIDGFTVPALPAPATDTATQVQPFSDWLTDFKTEAKSKGIQDSTLSAAMPYLTLNDTVLKLDQQQPEFTQTFWTYLDKRLSEIRIQAGKLQAFRYQSLLEKIQKEYGLPPEILVSFWGLETNYGTYLGNFSTLEALTTLAYNPRRSLFFRKELLAALRIIDRGNIEAKDMVGSWAGAIGQMQFMPTVYLKYALDADHDNKADLWHSSEDALTSAAAYLKQAGWQESQPWMQEVILPNGFDYSLADGKTDMSLKYIKALGIQPANGTNWQHNDDSSVILLLPAGHEGPAFIAWSNFKVIKRWNNSNNYAIAVGLMAQRLATDYRLSVKTPKDNKPWPKTFILQLQTTLTARGYDTGGSDGWFGSRSMQALRKFQKDNGLPADGYPNNQTLKKLDLSL